MTTSIDLLLEADIIDNENLDLENLPETILDLSNSNKLRLRAIEEYHKLKEDETIELISRLNGMYQMSGIKTLHEFLYSICTNSSLSNFLKLEAAKSLIEHNQDNEKLNNDSAFALYTVCANLNDVPTPCRIEAICKLMKYPKFETECNKFFKQLISDENIECPFRYNTILNIETLATEFIQNRLIDLFQNKDFVNFILDKFKHDISKEFPKYNPNPDNEQFFELLIERISYKDCLAICKTYLPDLICPYNTFLYNAQITFLFHKPNWTYYKILAGQYLLQHADPYQHEVAEEILSFAQDEELDYDRRADAADILLQLGDDSMKIKARGVITALGRTDGNVHTVFDNAQNVHNEQVEESVAEVLEFFAMLPLHMVDKTPIEFEQVKEQILDMIKKEKEKLRFDENGSGSLTEQTNICSYCESTRVDTLVIPTMDGPTHYCSHTCMKLAERQEKIELALKRIHLDRARYSKFNNTLSNILLKVWSYMMGHENEQEMRKRMLEELEEMSATCSTGFASRLINVISGFGEFNIRISWGDQVIANFSGRLNAAARKITEETPDNIFFHTRLHEVVSLWLNQPTQKQLYQKLRAEERWNKISELVDKFLETDRENKVRICIDDFAEAVLNEMMVVSSEWSARQHFGLFFRSNVAAIREEMYQEFKDHLDDTSFDLYMRKAIMSYEGEL